MAAIDPNTPIAGRYRPLREIGSGGFGAVYLVEHIRTGDHLALKVLHAHAGASADTVERFKREARAPARIRSEHVVKVTDADVAVELDGAPFLVMELLDGSDLERLIEQRGPLPPAEVVSLLAQAARALDKAHAIGIVHRDLKPENLFLHRREDGSSIVKILDFGISKVLGGEGGGSTAQSGGLTQSGHVFGTPLYMAPEQARGQASLIGPATDVWAMGLITYRLLTGGVYWTAVTLAELMLQIVADPMPEPSSRAAHLPSAFDAWFFRSCDRTPARRWGSAGEQMAALAAALEVPYATGGTGPIPLQAEAGESSPQASPLSPVGPPDAHATASALARSASGIAPSATTGRRVGLLLGALAAAAIVLGGVGIFVARRVASPAAEASVSVPDPAAAAQANLALESSPSQVPAAAPTSAPAPPVNSTAPVPSASTTSAARQREAHVVRQPARRGSRPAETTATTPSGAETPKDSRTDPKPTPKRYDPAAP